VGRQQKVAGAESFLGGGGDGARMNTRTLGPGNLLWPRGKKRPVLISSDHEKLLPAGKNEESNHQEHIAKALTRLEEGEKMRHAKERGTGGVRGPPANVGG